MKHTNLLIIFTKNPELGKCKTRLAETMGDASALKIYEALLAHTADFSAKVAADKHVYYSENIQEFDSWDDTVFDKYLQANGDLGQKMSQAFSDSFRMGYESIVIIGSDCAEINEEDIYEAFKKLANHDVVIGPAIDGGYYLLGMKKPHLDLFMDKSWSTSSLINETIATIKQLKLSFALLPEKSDIDYEEDLKRPNYLNILVE